MNYVEYVIKKVSISLVEPVLVLLLAHASQRHSTTGLHIAPFHFDIGGNRHAPTHQEQEGG